MNEAFLHLKNGETRVVSTPVGREFLDILYFMRAPGDAAGKTVRLRLPAGDTIDVPADDITGIEIPPPYALVPDFMTDAERERILAFTLAHADAFQIAGVEQERAPDASTTDYRIRRSRVLDSHDNARMAALMVSKLQPLMPGLWPQIQVTPLPLTRLECQVTAHGDGDFFAVHTDNGLPEIAHRRVSYVYYFHREPKQYSGGHLRLYHTLVQDNQRKCGRPAIDIDPPRNGLMVFPTSIYHEVTPIQCASSVLTDQRLTLNGWLTV